jgi:tetratricopeptide (TPR) repeat protein
MNTCLTRSVSVFLPLLFLLSPQTIFGLESADSIASSDTTYIFAVSLMEEGDYYRAIGEFKRYLFLSPHGEYADSAVVQIGRSLFSAGRYADVVSWHRRYFPEKNGPSPIGNTLLGKSYYRLEQYNLALDIMLGEARSTDMARADDESKYYSGLSYIRLDKYVEAKRIFMEIDSGSKFYLNAARYANILDDGYRYPTKSPRLAGILSILPGGGYAYCGYHNTAVSSLLINGLLFWATYSAFDNDNPGAGGFFSMLFVGFYSGNIYGSIRSAHRFNENERMDYQNLFVE